MPHFSCERVQKLLSASNDIQTSKASEYTMPASAAIPVNTAMTTYVNVPNQL